MSIFSRIFGIQQKNDASKETNNPEVLRFNEFEKKLNELLDKDCYLARSDYKPLCAEYIDIFQQFSVLKKSKTLKFYCEQNNINLQQTELFLEKFADLNKNESTEIITPSNPQITSKCYYLSAL